MDHNIEKRFVDTYIRKERRERLFYELTTPKKRYEGVSRFCHQAEELLDPSRIMMEGEDLDRREDFHFFVQKHDEQCYVLTPDNCAEGEYMAFKDAVDKAVIYPDAVIIIGSTFAVVFGEPIKGGRGKFLLSEE